MTKNKSKPIALLAIAMLWAGLAQAQESANASGGDATGSGGNVAYSLGQVIYTTNTNASGTVSQGVQQAYEIFTVGIKETELNISLSVFPNPTTDNLILHVDDFGLSTLNYQLYDIQGKLLNNGQIISKQTQIDLNNWPSATYFLHVINHQNLKIQTFKIVKL